MIFSPMIPGKHHGKITKGILENGMTTGAGVSFFETPMVSYALQVLLQMH
jgi:hypothetical protein